jgi:hypothetical protein
MRMVKALAGACLPIRVQCHWNRDYHAVRLLAVTSAVAICRGSRDRRRRSAHPGTLAPSLYASELLPAGPYVASTRPAGMLHSQSRFVAASLSITCSYPILLWISVLSQVMIGLPDNEPAGSPQPRFRRSGGCATLTSSSATPLEDLFRHLHPQ